MIDFLTSAMILAWLAILVLALAMAGLLRQVRTLSSGRPVRRQVGPPAGSLAPEVPGLEQLAQEGYITVLLFLDTNCDVCVETLRIAEELAGDRNGHSVRFVAIFSANADGATSDRIRRVENGNDIFARYSVPVAPFGVAINDRGRVTHAGGIGSPVLFRDFVNGTARERG